MLNEATAYDMGERVAFAGLDFDKVIGVVALGWTDSDSFCKIYDAYCEGNAFAVKMLNRMDSFIKEQ